MNEKLAFTGERFIPGTRGEIWIEHWHRYHFAGAWTAGKRVLDVACGEGYGSALLARDAARVTGVDIAPAAIAHARAAYASLGNLEFHCASCTALPCAEASIDVVVTFETLEHIAEQEAFLAEIARVLAPGGVLVLSCPNKLEYSDRRQFQNEFHVKELYREELARLVGRHFPHLSWFGQRPTFYSLIAPEKAAGMRAQLVEVEEAKPDEASAELSHPLYFVVVASRDAGALRSVPPMLSVLSDRDDWVHRDYEHVMADLGHYVVQKKSLEARVESLEAALERAGREAQALRSAVNLQEAAFTAQKALIEAQAAAHGAAIAERDRELLRRRGWRWWLKLPLIRMGLAKPPPL